jgi:hypothetical protein
MKGVLSLCFACILCGCGYHITREVQVTFQVPTIGGDETGKLSDLIIQELVATGNFAYVPHVARITLNVRILSDTSNRVAYRYDRDPNSGKLRKNILGTMNDRRLLAEVSIIDARTEKTIWGPEKVYSHADYDYVDPHSLHDLAFTGANGVSHTVLDFSLGQLDSEGGACIDVSEVAYRHLAIQIAQCLLRLPFFIKG